MKKNKKPTSTAQDVINEEVISRCLAMPLVYKKDGEIVEIPPKKSVYIPDYLKKDTRILEIPAPLLKPVYIIAMETVKHNKYYKYMNKKQAREIIRDSMWDIYVRMLAEVGIAVSTVGETKKD